MNDMTGIDVLQDEDLARAVDGAVRAIPPAWPLTATVAVNPFLGQQGEAFRQTAALLARIGGARLFPPRSHYAAKIAKGEILHEDLTAALQASPLSGHVDLDVLRSFLAGKPPLRTALPTVADLVRRETGTDWPSLIGDRIGVFAAGFFDEGQALWTASRRSGLYAAWRAFATHDLTPDILGLKGFGIHVDEAPETPLAAIGRASAALGIGAAHSTYFHQLLLTSGGWAQIARGRQFTAEREGRTDTTALELLAVRLVFEEALYIRHRTMIGNQWHKIRRAHEEPVAADLDILIDEVLQSASERAEQRTLSATLAAPAVAVSGVPRPFLQAAFCIDVRSEVFRRALESVDPGIRTIGFAGFFGLGIRHRSFASDIEEDRLPVLLNPSAYSCSEVGRDPGADREARFAARAVRAWGRFRIAAVSSFAFVEAMGPVYAGKLLCDGLGVAEATTKEAARPRFAPDLDPDTQAAIAATVLGAMSMTEGFGRYVLIAGHGANVVNNPFASSLHCGACGGHAGDVNARLLAGLLNDPRVRLLLSGKGILIPEDTVFLAGLHDTTTDTLALFESDLDREAPADDLERIRFSLAQAGRLTRSERARRLPRAEAADVRFRSRDWSEVRPELGLAGCRAFIVAPRTRTAGRSLGGRAFLHDYVWQRDEGFRILELILTAPVVVAGWISLQYYGSVVAPSLFGAGNKLLHNVVGGIGVVEGNGGTLRAGLPWQSVHDGENLVHEPLRLAVAVEAPRNAISEILHRHPQVRALFDNGWLILHAIDDEGRLAWRYAGALDWQEERHIDTFHP